MDAGSRQRAGIAWSPSDPRLIDADLVLDLDLLIGVIGFSGSEGALLSLDRALVPDWPDWTGWTDWAGCDPRGGRADSVPRPAVCAAFLAR